MNRHLAPFRRSFGLELLSFLPSRRSNALPSYPPAYDEISGYPRTSTPTELQPPDYEIAIQFPPFGVPPPTYAEVLNNLIENTVEAGGHQSPTQNAPVETDRTPNPENHQNGATTEFVSIEMPGYSSVRYSRNGTSDSTNTRPQVNGGITNTVVAANLFNIQNRNYYRSTYQIPLINSSEAANFLKRTIFTILVVLGMIYFRTSHPDWMPHWAFVVVLCLLILSLIQHLRPVFRDSDNTPRNDC